MPAKSTLVLITHIFSHVFVLPGPNSWCFVQKDSGNAEDVSEVTIW